MTNTTTDCNKLLELESDHAVQLRVSHVREVGVTKSVIIASLLILIF